MRMLRSTITLSNSIRILKNSLTNAAPYKSRSIMVGVAATLAVAASALGPGSAPMAHAAHSAAPVRQAAAQFLNLPFVPNGRMSVLSGWYYSGGGGFHGGIDFINGDVNSIGGWRTFPVIASADGEACGNCTSRQGNAVWIKHNINGATYYTYYGHLASITKGIPLGSQSNLVLIKRGQVIGMAGDTGARGILHLHYGLYNAASQPMDPYSIGKLRQYYPRPTGQPGIGWFVR